ncbi:MAG: SH3 domain-containing protein [Burkholderiales bacterium]|nr:SH3 domain-containing protein [Anaerolineae bacterium]
MLRLRQYSLGLLLTVLMLLMTAAVANAQDGRLNDLTALPRAAVYCHPDRIEVWQLDQTTGNGTLVLRVGNGAIAGVPSNPSTPTVIASSNGYALYRNPNGSLTVNGPSFQFTFNTGAQECDIVVATFTQPAAATADLIPQTGAPISVPSGVIGGTTGLTGLNLSQPVPLGGNYPTPTQTLEDIHGVRGYVVIGAEFLYLRSGDGTQYAPVAVLSFNTHARVLGRNDDASWWYIDVAGYRGWVNDAYVVIRGDLTGTPVVPVRGTLEQPRIYVGWDGNPVYSEPSYLSTLWICPIPGDREYAVVGISEDNFWFQIRAVCQDGRRVTAWIRSENGVLRNFGDVEIPVTWPS